MVPEGWEIKELGDVAVFKSGSTPSKQQPEYWGDDYPWVSAKDMHCYRIDSSEVTLTKKGRLRASIAPAGAVLILVRGMTLLKDLPVCYAMKELAFNQDVKALIPRNGIDSGFLFFNLLNNKSTILSLVDVAGHGTGRLDTGLLKSLPVSFPPLPEQTKIARILSTWDRAIDTTEKLIENSRQQKKSLMQQLVKGKKRLPGFEGEWRWQRLGELGATERPAVKAGPFGSSLKKDCYVNRGYKVYGQEQVISGDSSVGDYYISKEKYESLRSCSVLPGDILMSLVGTIGKLLLIPKEAKPGIINPRLIRISLNSARVIPEFLKYYLETEHAQNELARRAQGGTMGVLNAGVLKELHVPLPAVEEQKKINRFINCLDNVIEQHLKCLRRLRLEKQALMQQLLTGKRRVKVDELIPAALT